MLLRLIFKRKVFPKEEFLPSVMTRLYFETSGEIFKVTRRAGGNYMALKLISFEITAKKLDDQSQNEDKLDKKRSHREIND